MPGASRIPDAWQPADRKHFAGPALLDTHVWFWYLMGREELSSAETRGLFKRCVAGEGLLVSDISVWELANKAAAGKLVLLPNASIWIERASRAPGLTFLPLERDVLLLSTQLPPHTVRDPADRMLMASAILSDVPLITADRQIIECAGEVAGLSVCDVRA